MSTALPRPSLGPPTSALPALPVIKTRRSASALGTPAKTGLRIPSSSSLLPTSSSPATSTLPQPSKASSLSPGSQSPNTLRKAVSINAFPQPPGSEARSRVTSLPPSPLSAGPSSRKAKTQSGTPSLLNGSGDGKLAGARNSDGLISISSPPQSRSSSAQGSYSTSATQYDEIDPSQQNAEPSSAPPGNRDSSGGKSLKHDGKGNVTVSVRVRPDGPGHERKGDSEWKVDGRKSLIAYQGKDAGDYFYDNVFAAQDDNSRVYDHIAKRLVRRVMEGYHGTVFAYGMTGTGKTFSMQGTASSPGVIPLAITDIFSYIRETPSREFLLRVSYLEIYNEKIHDLLSMPTSNGLGANQTTEEIKLREDSKRGVYASPLKEEIVQSPTQLLRVIARGDQARRTASTQFNARSSRSHAVVQIVVESRERVPGALTAGDAKRQGLLPGGVRVSTLSLIDLAGSEKAAETKERRQEGSHINKSLLTLGTVIAKLSDHRDKDGKPADKDGKHLPYRDSKLTRLLQGALSGNSLVSILCTISMGSGGGSAAQGNTHTTETINTLKFASRAKNNIVSHAKRAEEALGAGGDGGARVLLERYRMEIVELRRELDAQAKGNGARDGEEAQDRDAQEERARELEAEARHEEQMLEMQLARTALKERIDHLNRLILSSKSIGVNAGGSYSSLGTHQRYSQTGSVRSSLAPSIGGRSAILERTSSMTSTSSTIGRRSARSSLGVRDPSSATAAEDDDSTGEFGDGTASLAAQNRALQSDLADKNRYIQTLEKRLLQARRASSARTSSGVTSAAAAKGGSGAIMVGEDHSVSALLREKDAEILELRAQLEDKDRMMVALRSAARSRDRADRVDRVESRAEIRSSLGGLEENSSNNNNAGRRQRPSITAITTSSMPSVGEGDSSSSSISPVIAPSATAASSSSGSAALKKQVLLARGKTRSSEEMKILDEMIQDQVRSGHIIRSVRGTVRVAPHNHHRKESEPAAAARTWSPAASSSSLSGDQKQHQQQLPQRPSSAVTPTTAATISSPPIQLQLLARHPRPTPSPPMASSPFPKEPALAMEV